MYIHIHLQQKQKQVMLGALYVGTLVCKLSMYVCNVRTYVCTYSRTYVCLGEKVFSCHSLHLFISYSFHTNETEKKMAMVPCVILIHFVLKKQNRRWQWYPVSFLYISY